MINFDELPLSAETVAECELIASLPTRVGWRGIARARGHRGKALLSLAGWRHAAREHERWMRQLRRGRELGCRDHELGSGVCECGECDRGSV